MTRLKLAGIVIAILILLIVAAIIIPCMMPPGMAANESSAVAGVRAIDNAENAYRAIYGGYANSLANLGGATPCVRSAVTACLIDQKLSSGVRFGYKFAAVGSNPVRGANTSYAAGAAPAEFNRTGKRRFCSTETNVIRMDANAGGSTIPPDGKQCAGFSALQ
jgi:type II secretory pathway pseudopilin PulG